MKKIIVSMFLITFNITIISSEQVEKTQPSLERNKNFIGVFGCHGVYTDHEKEGKHNHEKNTIYIINLEDEINKILQNNVNKDIAKIVTSYLLVYDYLHFNHEKSLLTRGISESNPDIFLSSSSNLGLNKDMIDEIKCILNASDYKEIINNVTTIDQWNFNQSHDFEVLFRKTGSNYLYYHLSHLGRSETRHTSTEDELEKIFREKCNGNIDLNSKKKNLLTATNDSLHFVEKVQFKPNKEDSLIKFLAISSIIPSSAKKEKDPQ